MHKLDEFFREERMCFSLYIVSLFTLCIFFAVIFPVPDKSDARNNSILLAMVVWNGKLRWTSKRNDTTQTLFHRIWITRVLQLMGGEQLQLLSRV